MRGVCIVDPTSARLARYSRRTSRSTAQPSKAPATTQRPPGRNRSEPGPTRGPATTSTTASYPSGAASAASATTRPRCRSTITSAPAPRTASALSPLHTATTRAPRAFASCTTASPTPPEAPVTRTRVVAGDRAPLEHAQRGAIGDGQRGQLHDAERRLVDTVHAVGRHDRRTRRSPVALTTEHVDRTRVRPRVLVVGGIDQHARPHDVSRPLAAGGNHGPGNVTALDAGEVERPQPARRRPVRRLRRSPRGSRDRCCCSPRRLTRTSTCAAPGVAPVHRAADHVRPAMPRDDDRPHR